MCVSVPGRVISIEEVEGGIRRGRISCGGLQKDVSLLYLPDVEVGEYVLVHVGFAISKVDPDEARRTMDLFEELGVLDELEAEIAAAERDQEEVADATAKAWPCSAVFTHGRWPSRWAPWASRSPEPMPRRSASRKSSPPRPAALRRWIGPRTASTGRPASVRAETERTVW